MKEKIEVGRSLFVTVKKTGLGSPPSQPWPAMSKPSLLRPARGLLLGKLLIQQQAASDRARTP